MQKLLILVLFMMLPGISKASIFGEETVVLVKMLANQLIELERLAENVGLSRERRDMLEYLNRGVEQATQQIAAIDSVINRAQGLSPGNVKRIADLNSLFERAKSVQAKIGAMEAVKLDVAESAVAQSALQADTSYKMGQELIGLGAELSREAQKASPGRATQITATTTTTQMISQGVLLQSLAQQTEILAILLELARSKRAEAIAREEQNRGFYLRQLAQSNLQEKL